MWKAGHSVMRLWKAVSLVSPSFALFTILKAFVQDHKLTRYDLGSGLYLQYYRHQVPAMAIFIFLGPCKGSRILLLLIILKSFYILLSTTEIRHSDQNITSLVTTMVFNLRRPIISIKSKIDFKNLKTVKLQSMQQDGIAMKKIKVPITDGGSFKGVLYTICEFDAVVATLNYSTSNLLFTNFCLCLAGKAKEEWDNITQPAKKTVEAFKEHIRAFKQVFMTSESKATLLEYIQEITKPKDMAVHTFVRRLQTLNRYAGKMADDEKISIFTDPQLKKFVFHAMPIGWQRTFIEGSKQLKSTTIQELIKYMDTQKNFADSHQESGKRRYESTTHTPSENHHDGRKHHHGNHKQKHCNKKFHGRQQDNAHPEKHTTRY